MPLLAAHSRRWANANREIQLIKAVIKFYRKGNDSFGMPSPYLSYLVVSSPWDRPDSGIASILSLSCSETPAPRMHNQSRATTLRCRAARKLHIKRQLRH